MATLILVILAVVGAPVAFFAIREATRDPIFAELDGWKLPAWAAEDPQDQAFGSRWCVRECRFRERTWQSQRPPEETNAAYVAALEVAGWRPWQANGCPAPGADGFDSCWQRDEYVLDLWVRTEPCDLPLPRPATEGGVADAGGAAAGGARAGTGQPVPGEPGALPEGCVAALASVKVFNRIAFPEAPA